MADARLCSIPDCRKPVRHCGLCSAHYQRLRRRGDPLAGGPMYGTAMHYLRSEVLLYDGSECLIWPFGRDTKGYAQVWVPEKAGKELVSRIVCKEHNGPPPTDRHEAAHSCGNGKGGCVAKNHLSWKTRAANQSDRLGHGTHSRGEQSGAAKLTAADVRTIRSLDGEKTRAEIASRFGVGKTTITNIINRQKWAWLT